ncbi:MAG: ferrous iron transport protein B [Thermodesulfobacteriota bacterium]
MSRGKYLIALAGQPNCGKSTVFNALTGAVQHVANYPGVTVDKLVGWYRYNGTKVEVVDLPGTYSLTSYSPEERVSRDFILGEEPSAAVNVMDASNLKRCLYLTFQLLEMEIPVVLNLNMMDVAQKAGHDIDINLLSQRLGIPVVPTTMKTGKGKKELMECIASLSGEGSNRRDHPARVDYGKLEPYIREIGEKLSSETALALHYPVRWLAIKLLEADSEAWRLIREHHRDDGGLLAFAEEKRTEFETLYDETPELHIAGRRYQAAADIARSCIKTGTADTSPLADKIDRFVCHRFLGPAILVGVIWLLYYLSIVQGYNLTNYTWPLLAKLRGAAEAVTPSPGFIDIPVLRSFTLWFVDSINALLNYVPIFFILFALIAVLEDSGYMPRMAFIMDRLLSRFGLHGQSTLPMVLGGVYVGGCAVPAVMSCKGIPDERSRFATILIIPMLNCLAKVPLYVLLVNIYFAAHKAWAMFFISTVSLLLVLPTAKILTLTVLKRKETAPFVMELPPYHLPTIRGVLQRAVERVWLFLRKITTIVAAVAVVLFVMLQFPGLDDKRQAHFEREKETAVAAFLDRIEGTAYADLIGRDNMMEFINYWNSYKSARLKGGGGAGLDRTFREKNPDFFSIVKRKGQDGTKAYLAAKKVVRERKKLLMQMRKERINRSYLGRIGKSIEPVTQWAGFNWRVNVALLSALAAKESSVATLGALYQSDERGQALEQRMAEGEKGFTSLHALALMLFMVLYPPCLATAIAVKLQAGSVKWMLFSMVYPMVLGLAAASAVFTLGSSLGLTGLQAMAGFYGLALAFTIFMGFFKTESTYT